MHNTNGEFKLNEFKKVIGCKGAIKNLTISDLFDQYKKKNSSELGVQRKRRFDLVQHRFVDFLVKENSGRKSITPEEVNRDHFLYFKNHLQSLGLSPNTIIGHLKILKATFREALNSKVIREFPFHECTTTYFKSNRIYLTWGELSKIENLPDLMLSERQKLVRDLFVFASYTGVSYSDLYEISTEHVVKSLQGEMIIKNRCKTNEIFRTPLSEVSSKLIEKYRNDQRKKRNKLFFVPCLNDYNRDLQVIKALCRIEKPLTSHIARHTMACLYLLGGGNIYTLASILGHSSVRTTQLYGKLQDSGIISEAKGVFKNLLNRDSSVITISRPKDEDQNGEPHQVIA